MIRPSVFANWCSLQFTDTGFLPSHRDCERTLIFMILFQRDGLQFLE